ncbi:hypothetical protein OC846_004324 [Tilletia horrida]|uniref:Neutral ceramidase n=1 Tax=Tilletia horrida TaxID=155126 RepID=A0AAN6GR02_9BASI|nr:hypothetical protein OC846_004324 [Tilletia horrida]KAK0564047.1 hypothetical protein OC861_004507 [Tilletia horrida]
MASSIKPTMDHHEKSVEEGQHLLPFTDNKDTATPAMDEFSYAELQQLQHQHQARQRRRSLKLILLALLIPTLLFFTLFSVCHHNNHAASSAWYRLTNHEQHEEAESTSASSSSSSKSSVVFGLGIGDVTGPIVGVNMMGYSSPDQYNTGLHLRERSRAYIVGSLSSSASAPAPDSLAAAQTALVHQSDDGNNGNTVDPVDGDPSRWIFVISDICMGDTGVRREVVNQLRSSYPGLYGERNFAWVGTHAHSGVGGYLNALAPTISGGGIVQQSIDAIVNGTVRAIVRAHEDYEARRTRILSGAHLQKGGGGGAQLRFGNTTLKDAHINRSKYSYALNPPEEQAFYGSDQDDEFALLRFDEGSDSAGFLSWYAVHGTSLYENNTLTSTDNKGLAAVLYETSAQPDLMPGKNTFLAGFSQASVGDTSPNTLGARCPDGSKCNDQHSTCPTDKRVHTPFGPNVTVSTCLGRGPGWGDADALAQSPTGSWDWKSNQIIAQKQVDAARAVMDQSLDKLFSVNGEVNSVKLNVDMSQFAFPLLNGTTVKTCPAAFGYGFAGGTTDGPGFADFKQGQNDTDSHDSLWDIVRFFFKQPSKEQMACQHPKRILLDVGNQHRPYDWAPSVVETQILRVGNMFILVMPGEFTTMAGRRIKEAVRQAIRSWDLLEEGQQPIVVLAGPANTYSHYITTREEYTAQRYEGGSTLYGPFTAEAYTYIYTNMLVPALKSGAGQLAPGPMATVNYAKAFHSRQRKSGDVAGWGKNFGDVLTQPNDSYMIPSSSSSGPPANVTASFVAANPANNLRLEQSYLEVQRFDPDSTIWQTIRTDSHPSTTMRWTATGALGTSRMDVSWVVESGTPAGRYRIVYWGDSKTPITGSIHEFFGVTDDFYLQ